MQRLCTRPLRSKLPYGMALQILQRLGKEGCLIPWTHHTGNIPNATLGYPWILVWIVYSCTYKYKFNMTGYQWIKGAGCTNKIPLPWLPWNSESKPRFRVQNIRLLRVGYLCSWFCLKVADRLLDAGASVNQADQFDKTCLDEAMKKARR